MKKFGLIGYPLGHSFSKGYFAEKFRNENIRDCSYENYPLEHIAMLEQMLEHEKDLYGLNVTIPYKQQVFTYLHEIDPEAEKVGAVNCIKIIRHQGKKAHLKGFNTDTYGFEVPLIQALGRQEPKALILGTGGASKAVSYILEKHHMSYRYVSRKPKRRDIFSYKDLTEGIIREHTLIVNTSPAGMYPNTDTCPDIPYEGITADHILYDLVYNPEKTLFLRKGEKKNATIINGLPMLHLQAERSWEIWNE
jgi:shikimate dehydrogenase